MTVPAGMLADSVYKMIAESREEFEKRLTNGDNRIGQATSFHHGIPQPNSLPKEDVGIWLDLSEITPDPDSPFGAEILIATWDIHIIVRDRGDDPHGYDPSLKDEVLGNVIESLTETLLDTSLNGAIEYLDLANAFSIPPQQPSGGDGLVAGWQLSIDAHMNMFPIRCP